MRPLSAGPARLRPTLWMGFGTAILFEVLTGLAWAEAGRNAEREEVLARGRELFLKEWVPGLPSRHGGDGLGPVYNESSCVACHNQGGIGGGGSEARNVELLTSLPRPAVVLRSEAPKRLQDPDAQRLETRDPVPDVDLVRLHLGFAKGPSVVLHRFGILHRFGSDSEYVRWRRTILSDEHDNDTLLGGALLDTRSPIRKELFNAVQSELFGRPRRVNKGLSVLLVSERNPPPLYGLGLIDRLPDAVIEASEARSKAGTFGTQGRVCRLEGGRIGRFGWKAQAATLGEFVRIACATELGLEVPGHRQSGLPRDKNYHAPGRDLEDGECDALTAYVASLPAPIERAPIGKDEQELARAGVKVFSRIGCAKCHTPTLGPIVGLYSDLMLHDMGPELSGSGDYGETPPQANDKRNVEAARPTEWRTPPLWGLRDSGPYLHDGRATTLEEAIAFHGGQANEVAERYFNLLAEERRNLQLFLKSLATPGQEGPAEAERRPQGR